MQKNIITLAVAIVLIAGLFGTAFYFNSRQQSESDNSYEGFYTQSATENKENSSEENQKPANQDAGEIVLYYGEECPHCHEVIDYLKENKISEKVQYGLKEVWHNKDNQKTMMKKVEECNLNPQEVGVPFLYAKGKCYIGTPDVLDFFKKEAASK